MRTLPAQFAQALSSGATTLCWCWKLERADGVVLGFTDHDRAISFDGTNFDPETGFSASAVESALGLAPDNAEVVGALRSDRITSEDLANGLYDGARALIYRVDWRDPEQRVLMRSAQLGEVRHGTGSFTAELIGLLDGLSSNILRSYQYHCDARLGDARCGVDVTTPDFRTSGNVSAVSAASKITVSGLDGFADGWFSDGLIEWTSGANADSRTGISRHDRQGSRNLLSLWSAPPHPISAGDEFIVTAGCDKRSATCSAKFSNSANFRGFPHMPGNDFFFSYPKAGS